MGLFWKSSDATANGESNGHATDETMPDDLDSYLKSKESQLSTREFKALLKRQSDNVVASRTAEREQDENGSNPEGDFLSMVQARPADNPQEGGDGEKAKLPKLPSGISTANSMKKPKEYLNYETEKYRREHDERESVLINCSEIQNAFYQCLNGQKVWDRISAVTKLESDDCTRLADFFMACTDIQKKAFLLFDYPVLDSVDEMKGASRRIDKTFTNNFKSIEDVQDKEKFLNYTKELRAQREDFFTEFNK